MNIKNSLLERKRKYDLSHFEKTKYGKNLLSLKNKYYGKRCFIIGNGPSLNANDLDRLKEEYTFAFNRIYYMFDHTEWRPTFYCTQDYKIASISIDDINKKIQIPYIFAPINLKWYYGINLKTRYYFCQKQTLTEEEIPVFSKDISREIGVGNTVTYTAIQIAVYMGFKEIYLLGVDHNFHLSQDKNGNINVDDTVKDYFCNGYNKEKENLYIPRLDLSTLSYISAQKFVEENDVKIYNATRGGKLEIFPRINIDELFKKR